MRKLFTSTSLLFSLSLLLNSNSLAQTLIPLDYRDLIGQRLGWSAEKIHNSVTESTDFVYIGHFTKTVEPGTFLHFTGTHQEALNYTFVDDVAVDATLSIPAGPYALDMMKSVQQSCKMLAYIPEKKIAKYQSPYCSILVYRETQDGIDKVFFVYTLAKP